MLFYLLLPFLSLLLIVLQSTITDMIFAGRFVLELSLIIVVYAGFHLDLIKGTILAVLLGFILDCVSGSVTGLLTFIYMAIFLFSFYVSDWLDTEKIYVIVFFCFICAFLKEIILIFFYYLAFKINVLTNMRFIFFAQALVIGLFAPIFFNLIKRTEEFFYGKKT